VCSVVGSCFGLLSSSTVLCPKKQEAGLVSTDISSRCHDLQLVAAQEVMNCCTGAHSLTMHPPAYPLPAHEPQNYSLTNYPSVFAFDHTCCIAAIALCSYTCCTCIPNFANRTTLLCLHDRPQPPHTLHSTHHQPRHLRWSHHHYYDLDNLIVCTSTPPPTQTHSIHSVFNPVGMFGTAWSKHQTSVLSTSNCSAFGPSIVTPGFGAVCDEGYGIG
jgi:hypothetical protein